MKFWYNEQSPTHIGSGIPEKEKRLSLLDKSKLEAKTGQIERYSPFFSLAHSEDYLVKLRTDSVIWKEAPTNPGSYKAISSYASLCLEAADLLVSDNQSTFVVGRPPGHHSHRSWTWGFCFINNAALTAIYFHKEHKKRVAALDFDLHHGDGTEEILNRLPEGDTLFVSTYDALNFPGTKYNLLEETLQRNTYHLPIIENTRDSNFLPIIKKIERKLKEFDPEVLVVSAGFDMCHFDTETRAMPSKISITSESYKAFKNICNQYPHIIILEGGYSPKSIKEGLDSFGL